MKKKQMRWHGIFTMLALVCLIAALLPFAGILIMKILIAAAVVCIILCIYTGHKMLKTK